MGTGSTYVVELAGPIVPKARPRERGRLPAHYRVSRDRLAADIARRRVPRQSGPLKVTVFVATPAPTKRPKWLTAEQWAELEQGHMLPCPVNGKGRGDVDNLAGAVMDSATLAGVWDDDRQVTTLKVSKAVVKGEARVLFCVGPDSGADMAEAARLGGE